MAGRENEGGSEGGKEGRGVCVREGSEGGRERCEGERKGREGRGGAKKH